MAKQTRKASYLAGSLFLFSSVCFTVVLFGTWASTHTTFDKVLKLIPPVAMLLTAAIFFVRGSKLPTEERGA